MSLTFYDTLVRECSSGYKATCVIPKATFPSRKHSLTTVVPPFGRASSLFRLYLTGV